MDWNNINTKNIRFERKFLISNIDSFGIEAILRIHPAGFSEIHYQRYVNNIYFDSLDMDSFFDVIMGVNQRRKIRIRWYGALAGKIKKPNLEIKLKNNSLTNKISYELKEFTLEKYFIGEKIRDWILDQDIPEYIVSQIAFLRPSIINRYLRKYFLSIDGNFRVTVDKNIEFYKFDPLRENFWQKRVDRTNIIVELKYSREMENNADKITSHFPFRITKNSKYVSGVYAINY